MRRRPLALLALGLLLAGGGAWLAARSGARATRRAAGAPAVPVPAADPTLAAAPEAIPEETEPESAPPAPGRLTVRVRTANDAAVPGATVEVRAGERTFEATTDAEGNAALDAVPAGDVVLRVSAERFVGTTSTFPFYSTDEARTADVVLRAGLSFRGRVVDAADGAPVAGADVEFALDGSFDGTRSGADGTFRGAVPADGAAYVRATARGYLRGEVHVRSSKIRVRPDPAVVRLVRCGRLVGTVRDASGAPHEGADVEVRRKGDTGSEPLRAQSGADGRYAVEALEIGVEYAVAARTEIGAAAPRVVVVDAAAPWERTADFTLEDAGTLVVRLVDPDGPVGSAIVTIGEPPWERAQSGPTDDDAYAFRFLDPGEARILVRSPRHRDATATVLVEPGATVETTVRMDPGAHVEGLVVGEDARAVDGAIVEAVEVREGDAAPPILGAWAESRRTRTDARGRFALSGFRPGPVALRATTLDGNERVVRRTLEVVSATAPAGDVRLTLVLLASVTIRLIDPYPDGDEAPEPVTIFLRRVGEGRSPGEVLRRKLASGGRLRLDGLEAGEYLLEVSTFYLPVRRAFTAALRKVTDLGDATLDPGLFVEARVVDAHGAAVAGARVWVEEGSSVPSPSGVSPVRRSRGFLSDADGRFTLAGVAAGPTSIEVDAEGFAPVAFAWDVAEDGAPLRIVVTPGGLLRGLLLSPDGSPQEERGVCARAVDRPGGAAEAAEWHTTDVDGAFEMRLQPGRYRLVMYEGPYDAEEEVVLGEWTAVEGETHTATYTVPAR